MLHSSRVDTYRWREYEYIQLIIFSSNSQKFASTPIMQIPLKKDFKWTEQKFKAIVLENGKLCFYFCFL